jgi:hypothetical protein
MKIIKRTLNIFLDAIHKTMSGIQTWFSLRLIREDGFMSKDKLEARRYSCCCSGCLTGINCLVNDAYNSWSTVEMTLKEAIVLEPVVE